MIRTNWRYLALLPLLLALPQPAAAAVLYNNGAPNGTVDAFPLVADYTLANSFTLPTRSIVTSIDFGVWNDPEQTISTIDWTITAGVPDGGANTTFAAGTASVTSSVLCVSCSYGLIIFDLNLASFSVGNLPLNAGTYYLSLTNAVVTADSFAYWDENDGPSVAWWSVLGYLTPGNDPSFCLVTYCSESFQVNGVSEVIEPTSLMLFGTGIVLLATRVRRHAR
jgi:hypothetical protein